MWGAKQVSGWSIKSHLVSDELHLGRALRGVIGGLRKFLRDPSKVIQCLMNFLLKIVSGLAPFGYDIMGALEHIVVAWKGN